jgi:hypothetical protein
MLSAWKKKKKKKKGNTSKIMNAGSNNWNEREGNLTAWDGLIRKNGEEKLN